MGNQIFIGGTGRSGTSILYRLLDAHPDIYAFDLEMRFLIDYDGLITLADALTTNYSVPYSREALCSFERMMREDLTHRYSPPYVGFDFHEMFGEEFYNQKLDDLISVLTQGSFHGTDYPVRGGLIDTKAALVIRFAEKLLRFYNKKISNTKRDIVLWPHREMRNVKFFNDRESLMKIFSDFVDGLFMKVTREAGKKRWCEKTPSNVLHLDYLYDLFPDCHFIHIKRDPRGVVQSMQNQFWSTPDLEESCISMKQVYQKFFSLKKRKVHTQGRYLEIKLEDLAGDYDATVDELVSFLEVDNKFVSPPKLSIQKVDYWKKALPERSISLINEILHDEIEMMGYKV